MKKRLMRDGIWMMGAVDWNRRLFDSLIPLPEGTSYNAYLVKGSEKVALIDTADPELEHVLMEQLEDVERVDYIISLHTEQDHSGAIPTVLAKYPEARVVCSTKAKELLIDHIHLDESVIDAMPDGSSLPRRQALHLHPYAVGPLAGDDVRLPARGAHPLLVRLLRFAPRHVGHVRR